MLAASNDFTAEAVAHYARQLHGFLSRRLNRPHEIDDLVQETYLALLKIPSINGIANPRAYVLRVAAHVLHRFAKRDGFRGRYVEVNSELVDFTVENPREPARDSVTERISSQDQLCVALRSLPAVYQAVLLMRYAYGYSHQEIGEKLEISGCQVERYITRAKRALIRGSFAGGAAHCAEAPDSGCLPRIARRAGNAKVTPRANAGQGE